MDNSKTEVSIGDEVNPLGLELVDDLAWKVIGFVSRGRNPKYYIRIQHPISGDTLRLENLPYNTKKE